MEDMQWWTGQAWLCPCVGYRLQDRHDTYMKSKCGKCSSRETPTAWGLEDSPRECLSSDDEASKGAELDRERGEVLSRG